MHKLKKYLSLLVVAVHLMMCTCNFVHANVPVEVVLNGESVALGQIENGRTLVPIRVLAEAFGCVVSWNGDTQTVTISKDNIKNVLNIDSCVAVCLSDGAVQTYTLDVAPVIYDSRTYVPLRYLSESFGCAVVWYSETNTVYISSPMKIEIEAHEFVQSELNEKIVTETFGKPYDALDGSDGVRRLVYLNSKDGYLTVFGFYNNQLFEFFTNAPQSKLNGVPISELREESEFQTVNVFCDKFDHGKPVAFYLNVCNRYYSPYVIHADKVEVTAQEEKLTFYIVNSLRMLAGKKALAYSSALAAVNDAHVASMAANNYFSHEGPEGDGIVDRIAVATGYKNYTLLGEILAKVPNAYYAAYGWLNSENHRSNMLNGAYEYTGISVDGNLNQHLYYAQVLVKLK